MNDCLQSYLEELLANQELVTDFSSETQQRE